MEKQKYIDIFWSNPTGEESKRTNFRKTWERVSKKMQKEENVSTLFMFPVDYCLYELLSEQEISLRMPNVIHGYEESPEAINVICIAAMNWYVIFYRYKEIKAEYKCPVKLTVFMSSHFIDEIKKLLETEDVKEISEFMENITFEEFVQPEEIGWINVAKRVLLNLCHGQNKNRLHIAALEFSQKELLELQSPKECWNYQGYATQIPDLMFDENIEFGTRKIQHGIFYYTESMFNKCIDKKIQMFIKCSWNDRKRFVCDFKPVVYMPALTISDVDKIFRQLFPEWPKKNSISKIKKYKYIKLFFECVVAGAFKNKELRFSERFIWELPNGVPEIFSEMLEKRRHEFLNMVMGISIGSKVFKREYFTNDDYLPDESNRIRNWIHGRPLHPTPDFGEIYRMFNRIMLKQMNKENFVSVEKYQKFMSDYLIKDSETQKIFGIFMMEHFVEDGVMVETYREKNGFIQQGFIPGENLGVLAAW